MLISYRLVQRGLPSTLFRPGFQQAWGIHLYSLSNKELQSGSGPHVEISTHKNTEKPKMVICVSPAVPPKYSAYLHGLTRVRCGDIKRLYGNYGDSLAEFFYRIKMLCLYHGALPRDLPVVRVAVVGESATVVSCFKDKKHGLNIGVSSITYRSLLLRLCISNI